MTHRISLFTQENTRGSGIFVPIAIKQPEIISNLAVLIAMSITKLI
jgi:hypothetical protein